MKKCSHGDLVQVTKKSIRNGSSLPSFGAYLKYRYEHINFICNRILLSKLIRTMTEIK